MNSCEWKKTWVSLHWFHQFFTSFKNKLVRLKPLWHRVFGQSSPVHQFFLKLEKHSNFFYCWPLKTNMPRTKKKTGVTGELLNCQYPCGFAPHQFLRTHQFNW
jgi:hypothetical protein